MTIDAFIALVKSIDKDAARYEYIKQKSEPKAYTVFAEYKTKALYANGVIVEKAIMVQVDYFTQTENDPKAQAYFDAFTTDDNITCQYDTDFESDTRYIHHIYDCEVIS